MPEDSVVRLPLRERGRKGGEGPSPLRQVSTPVGVDSSGKRNENLHLVGGGDGEVSSFQDGGRNLAYAIRRGRVKRTARVLPVAQAVRLFRQLRLYRPRSRLPG